MNAKILCNIHLEVTLSSVVGGGVAILYAQYCMQQKLSQAQTT